VKLISLNIWAGREFKPLLEYISEHSDDTDVFCFQEVFDTPTQNKIVSDYYRANIFSELQRALPNHKGYFAPVQDGCGFDGPIDYKISWGLAMFLRKSLKINKIGEIYLFGHRNSRKDSNLSMPRNLQYAHLETNEHKYAIAHFHGLWNGRGKTDTEDRLEQSKIVRQFWDKIQGKKILCGDFNLLPNTESISILEDGLVNLIKTNQIKKTRSILYPKPDKYADYTIVSSDIKVESFAVPPIKVSDHLPMELEFS